MSDDQGARGKKIGLADAIASLRAELSTARGQGDGSDVRFKVGDIEVELSVEFGWTVDGNAGFKVFSFVDVGGKAGTSDKATQKIKLKLTIDPQGDPARDVIKSALDDPTVKPIG
jgi:Trypsin-co-occurring domain 2